MEKKIEELNEENIANTELFQELMTAVENQSDVPYIEKNKVIMAPGVWNDLYYSKEEIIKAFKNTDWTEKYNSNLILDHENDKFRDWVGEVNNRRLDEKTGYIYGDLYVYDPITAVKLKYGKPKSGVSPRVLGKEEDKSMKEFTFNNFAIVINPAVKKAFINNSDGSRPVFVSEGGVIMSEENKENIKDTKPVENTKEESPVKVSEMEEFTKYYDEYIKENSEASLKDIFNSFMKTIENNEEPKKEEDEPEDKKEEEKKKEDDEDEEVKVPQDELGSEKPGLQELNKKISEMAQTIKELTERLETPEKLTKKGSTVELSQNQDSDDMMMSFLKGI